MRVTQKEIDQAYVDHSATYSGIKEDYFALLHLMRSGPKTNSGMKD